MVESPLTANDWLRDLLAKFRLAWAYQRQGNPLGLYNLEDFSPPCQLYLFWFRLEPDTHYSRLIRMALADRPDGETEVIGPIAPAEANSVLYAFLSQERWLRSVESPCYLSVDDRDNSLKMLLAQTLRDAQKNLDEYIVHRARNKDTFTRVQSKSLQDYGFTWDIYGDPRSLKPEILIAEERLFSQVRRNQPSPSQPEPDRISAHATHIYPHVWVGEPPSQTPEEVLQGSTRTSFMDFEPALDTQYRGRRLVVLRGGLIAIEAESSGEARADLNHITAALLISGQDVRTVRPNEVGQAEIDPVSGSVDSFRSEIVSMRTIPSSTDLEVPDMEFRDRVDVDTVNRAILNAETVAGNSYLCNTMSFLLEAHTHYEAQEYRQSFVMSWLIVESWLDKAWGDALRDKEVSKQRKERLSEGTRVTAELKSEMLELLGYIDREQLSNITTLRKARNKVVHEGYEPIQQKAQKALEFARELCSAQLQKATLGT